MPDVKPASLGFDIKSEGKNAALRRGAK